MSRKSMGQIFCIIAAVSVDNNVNKHEIQWIRKELKNWFNSFFCRF